MSFPCLPSTDEGENIEGIGENNIMVKEDGLGVQINAP